MANRHMKGCAILLVFREMQIKTKPATTTHLFGCLQLKRLSILSAGKCVENLELSGTAGGMYKGV